ncbi:glycosyl transferase [Leptolyngbya sp. FACHB-261]|uniref:glycosyl transferase n=1 Tax=Leptolyngbya sp. FACHB-261 TaxID=2692806 RepID=UPI001681F5B6|nr:glycosyl transferase [Leptolyngbya sp. FACHB-261]MBD2104791.1 glycosyl transferase [Leptolyngbya sp. FACHB-261]
MPRPALYAAITSHGFGHATRTAAVLAEVQRQCPDVLLVLTTSAPRWLLEAYLPGHFILRPRDFEPGVVQADSLTMDQPATLEKLKAFQARQQSFIAAEVDFIQRNRIQLLLMDMPPSAVAIAQAAGVPSWAVSNFGWDFVYQEWGGEFAEIANSIRETYQHCDRLFRLPFHEPMSVFPVIEDIGLTGGWPRHSAEEVRLRFRLPEDRPIALLTFGGLGLGEIPYQNVLRHPDWFFVTFDRRCPTDLPNLMQIQDRTTRPVDVMPLCSRVISKPGYGTLSEACRVGVPVTCLERQGFAEAKVLLEGLQDYSEHQIIPPEEFYQGNWDFLYQKPLAPRSSEPITKNGNETLAAAIVAYLTNLTNQ